MGHADALSRRPYPENVDLNELEPKIGLDKLTDVTDCYQTIASVGCETHTDASLQTSQTDETVHTSEIDPLLDNLELVNLSILQELDQDCRPILNYLRKKVLLDSDQSAHHLLLIIDQYVIHDKVLHHLRMQKHKEPKLQVVVAKALRDVIMTQAHSDVLGGHFRQDKTYATILLRYYWPGMYVDVTNFVSQCISCSQKKRPRRRIKASLKPLPLPSLPFERVSVDVVGPLPTTYSGKKYLLCFTDHLTRFPEVFAYLIPKLVQLQRFSLMRLFVGMEPLESYYLIVVQTS